MDGLPFSWLDCLISAWVACIGVVTYWAMIAPRGWEGETGFHYGPHPDDAE